MKLQVTGIFQNDKYLNLPVKQNSKVKGCKMRGFINDDKKPETSK